MKEWDDWKNWTLSYWDSPIVGTERSLIKMMIPNIKVIPIEEKNGQKNILTAEDLEKKVQTADRILGRMWEREKNRPTKRFTRLMLYRGAVNLLIQQVRFGRIVVYADRKKR